ncbi:MAG: tRNA (adenosine(37)-N6)-threonylcarbamoyltransferase complex ATPase subunit type 1 TsaE [Bacteroidia bacterium]
MAVKQWRAKTEKQLHNAAQEILDYAGGRKKFAIQGAMGAGKTTLIKAFCHILEVPDSEVSSPTFSLVNEYQGQSTIYHFDVYRLRQEEEMYDLGYEEYFYSEAYVFIEWPELIPGLIPPDFMLFRITEQEDGSRLIAHVLHL